VTTISRAKMFKGRLMIRERVARTMMIKGILCLREARGLGSG